VVAGLLPFAGLEIHLDELAGRQLGLAHQELFHGQALAMLGDPRNPASMTTFLANPFVQLVHGEAQPEALLPLLGMGAANTNSRNPSLAGSFHPRLCGHAAFPQPLPPPRSYRGRAGTGLVWIELGGAGTWRAGGTGGVEDRRVRVLSSYPPGDTAPYGWTRCSCKTFIRQGF
jgi:hypothetical protein